MCKSGKDVREGMTTEQSVTTVGSPRIATVSAVIIAGLVGFFAGRASPTASDGEGRTLAQCEPKDASPFSFVSAGAKQALVAPLQLSYADSSGSLVPANFKDRIIIELGANAIYTVRDTLFKKPAFKSHFVLSFEPLLDKYATNIARSVKPVMRNPLGHHHRRGVILPFAVGPNEGITELQVSDIDGCSSLLKFTMPAKGQRAGCAVAREQRRVPTVTLHTVLGWLPTGTEVDFLKSDIQGMDLQAISSAADRIRMLRRVQLEVALGAHINEGSAACSEALKQMSALGFRLATAAEIGDFAPLEGAFGTPLVYEGGPITCGSKGKKEADLFFIRREPPVPAFAAKSF